MLRLHRAERADALTGPLAALLADAPEDPFTPDVVAVPTRGVERWLAQRLSHHLGSGQDGEGGVCANVVFPSPATLVTTAVGGLTAVRDDPWDADRLVWPLLAVIDQHADASWCATLGRHLGVGEPDGSHRRSRRFAVARRLATLFASYGSQRPWVTMAWAGGDDAEGARTGDTVPVDLAWQPELWRRLRERVGAPSPAERLDDALRAVEDDPASVPLPRRLSVFGPTRLPEDQLRVLTALARHREVHLWLPHPSPALWAATSSGLSAATTAGPTSRRRADLQSSARHPLLASLARDSTELQLRLAALQPATDAHHEGADLPPTLLGTLQRQLRDDSPPDVGGSRLRLDGDDRSVQVHACHGRARQVEVLREVLLQLFAADDTLEPREVLVMCPDIETFAPLVSATFGLAADGDPAAVTHPGHRLRVRLADRSLRQTNPLLALIGRLLDMADGRVTASEVMDVAASDPVRRRFGLDDDDLDRLRGWTVSAGARWGENVSRRSRYAVGHVGQGTWEAALDRILVGAAMAEEDERWLLSALPLDDVDSMDIDLAGRFAELVDRLTGVLAELDGARPLGHWLDALGHALDVLADTGRGPDDAWQGVQARRVLGDVREAGRDRGDVPLRLPEVRALLGGRLEGRPTRANFRTGHLTMCSLIPMRSVPHRVVCLLGMDDGAFPRGAARDGNDLLLREPLLGERDRRSEDRQLFLDAVMAAGDHLVVLHTGADERTGAPRAPAVPVAEVLDALDQTAATPEGRPAREQVLVRHPLQPFDPRNFVPGALGVRGPASFDAAAHAGAVASRSARAPAAPFLPGPLPPAERHDGIDLDDLVRFLEHPAKEFLRRRLVVSVPFEDDDLRDRIPLQLDSLDGWKVGDRLLASRLGGADGVRSRQAEWRRGEVPPRALGNEALGVIEAKVEPLVAAALSLRTGRTRSVDAVVDLPDGRTLSGTLAVDGDMLLRAAYSTLAAKHRVRAWVQLLALAAASPGPWTAVTIGRGRGARAAPKQSVLAPPEVELARELLAALVDLRDRGLREPLPMPVKASAAYAAVRHGQGEEVQALDAARSEWQGGFAERDDDHHRIVWGVDAPLNGLLAAPPAEELSWWPDETTRFGVLARQLWEPLLCAESVVSL